MMEEMTALLAALGRAQTFDEAARVVLTRILEVAEEALAASPFAGEGKLLRAMAHLRPADGYRQLVVVEQRSGEKAGGGGASGDATSYLPSATAFRWVSEHRTAVSVDVQLRLVRPHTPGVGAIVDKGAGGQGAFDSKESRTRLLGRSAGPPHLICRKSRQGSRTRSLEPSRQVCGAEPSYESRAWALA